MARSRSPEARAASTTSPRELAVLARLPDIAVRRRVVSNAATPADVLADLSVHPAEDIRALVASHPATPDATLIAFAERESLSVAELRALSNRNPSDDAPVYRTVTNSHHNGYRLVSTDVPVPVATGGRFSVAVLTAFAQSPHPPLQAVAANQWDTPIEVLHALITHDDIWVRTALAQNPVLDVGALLQLVEKGGSEPLQMMAQRDDLSLVVMTALAMSRSSYSHDLLLEREDAMDMLMNSDEPKARAMVAGHLDDDDNERWHRLLGDPSPVVREAAAIAAPTPLLEAQVGHPCKRVRQVVAKNCVSLEVLRTLAVDDEALVRRRVARNPILDTDTLHLMSTDTDERTRRYAGDAFIAAFTAS